MDPFEPLKYQKPLRALKARIAEEGSKAVFAPLIEKFILNNPHRVTIEMQVYCSNRKAELYFIGRDHIISLELLNLHFCSCQPDPEKASRDEEAEREILNKLKASMTEADLAELARATQDLRLKQETPDPPEALKSVPSLSLQDIPKKPIEIPIEVTVIPYILFWQTLNVFLFRCSTMYAFGYCRSGILMG